MNKPANAASRWKAGWVWHLIPCIFCLALLATDSRAASIVIIDDSSEQLPLADFVDILDDPNNTLTPGQILGSPIINEFRPIDLHSRKTLAEYSNNFWLRFSTNNTTGEPQLFWLHGNESAIHALALYAITDTRQQAYTEAGNALFDDDYSTPILKEVFLPPKGTTTWLAKINSIDKAGTDIELARPDSYVSRQVTENRTFFFGLGMLCFLAFISLFFTLYRNSRVFLGFCCYLLAIIGFEATGAGIPHAWHPNFAEWKYPTIFCFYYIASAHTLIGMQAYMQLSNAFSSAYKTLILAQYSGFFIFLLLLAFFNPYSVLNHLPALIAVGAIVNAAIHNYRKHNDSFALSGGLLMLLISCFLLFFSHRDSSIYGLNLLATPVFLYAILVASSGFFIIITILEFKQIAHEFRKKMLEQISDSKQKAQIQILSEISHDIRTPVSGILGMADLLKLSSLTINQQEKIEAIRSAGQSLLNKITELNNRLRLQQNDSTLHKYPFELPLLIETCVNSFRLMAEEKNIELITHIQADVPTIVTGDESRLRQILMQLIANAIKNTSQGEVMVNVSRPASSADAILFSVRDTGKGLSEQMQSELQSTVSGKEPVADLNIGIQTTKQLLAQLKSALQITSRAGEGSDFGFTVSLPPATPAILGVSESLQNILVRKKLLVVDDNQTCCKVLKQQAGNWGMNVKEVHNGNEAIAMFRAMKNINEPFDAIIIDYDMPNMMGTEVAARISAETDSPPIMIMLTGLSMAPTNEAVRKAGITTILTKPASEKLIQMTLANALQAQHNNPAPAGRKPLHILVAEDSNVSRSVISRMLDNLKVEYKMVSDGKLAVDAARRERFDLILMDSNMPFMDGFEAARKIHEWQHELHQLPTPIVELTAYLQEDHREKRESAGMQGYLEKPIRQEALEALLRLHTGRD